jgi:hypothetical protein
MVPLEGVAASALLLGSTVSAAIRPLTRTRIEGIDGLGTKLSSEKDVGVEATKFSLRSQASTLRLVDYRLSREAAAVFRKLCDAP